MSLPGAECVMDLTVQNEKYSKTKFSIPLLVVGAGYIPHLQEMLLIIMHLNVSSKRARYKFSIQDMGLQKSGQTL